MEWAERAEAIASTQEDQDDDRRDFLKKPIEMYEGRDHRESKSGEVNRFCVGSPTVLVCQD